MSNKSWANCTFWSVTRPTRHKEIKPQGLRPVRLRSARCIAPRCSHRGPPPRKFRHGDSRSAPLPSSPRPQCLAAAARGRRPPADGATGQRRAAAGPGRGMGARLRPPAGQPWRDGGLREVLLPSGGIPAAAGPRLLTSPLSFQLTCKRAALTLGQLVTPPRTNSDTKQSISSFLFFSFSFLFFFLVFLLFFPTPPAFFRGPEKSFRVCSLASSLLLSPSSPCDLALVGCMG